MVGKDAGEAVGLQLDADLQGIALLLAHALPRRFHLIHDAEQLLHVMADLMGEDIGLGEVALHLEAVLQLLIEAEVDINFLVVGAIEGTHGRHPRPAGRAHRAAEQDELGIAVILAILLEDVLPNVLGVGEDDGHELLEIVLAVGLRVLDRRALRVWGRDIGRIGARLRQVNIGEVRLIPRRGATAALHDDARVDAEKPH